MDKIADLKWLLEAPDFLSQKDPEILLIPDVQAIQDTLNAPLKRHTLGAYFEHLLDIILMENPDISHLEKNIQVFEEKRTVGEFDFLFRFRNKPTHLEVAIKYYLGFGDLNHPENWLGPKTIDRLDLKLDKMLGHQMKLSETPAGQEKLSAMGFQGVEAMGLIKGVLFYPFDQWQAENFSCPETINLDHLKGWWLHFPERAQVLSMSEQWIILQKPHWLSVQAYEQTSVMNSSELDHWVQDYFAEKTMPVQVCAVDMQDGQFQEKHRGFIVPQGWPHQRPSRHP